MRNFKIISVLFLFSIMVQAQTIMDKDSLLHLLKTTKDTALVKLYINIGQQYEGNNNDSAKYYYKASGNLSKKIGYKIGELKYIANYTYILNIEGKKEEALQLNHEAVQIALKLKDNKYIGIAYANVGSSYQYMEELESAVKYYLIAETYLNKTDYPNIGIIYSNIGIIYFQTKQIKKALVYHIKAEKIARNRNLKNELAIALSNKSTCLLELKQFSQAEKALLESMNISKSLNNLYIYSNALLNLCDLKIKSHQYSDIKKYADQVLAIAKENNIPENAIIAYRGLAIYHLHQKNFTEANRNALLSLEMAKEQMHLEHQKKALNILAEIAFANQKIQLAYDYQSSADSIDGIISIKETSNKIEEVKGKYESEKKELQIKGLTQQNEIKDLKIKRRLWTAITLFFAFIGMVVFAFSQYRNFKTKKALLVARQENAIAEERLRIASDMHDDVGSGLSRIRYIIGAVVNGQTEQSQGLEKITDITDDSIQKMKEIIWSLNENNQNLEDLVYYIRGQMSKMAEDANINFVCQLPENIPTLFFGWKRNRNTYLLVKEVVNNALKHARAKTITLNFEIADELRITISDDGVGFDTTKNFTGNGLNNYKKRMAELNARYTLVSEIDKGTTFVVQIPIHV